MPHLNFFKPFRTLQTISLSLIFTFAAFAQIPKSNEPEELPPNKIIERQLPGGETHRYKISLKKDEFLQVTVEQKGVDVAMKLLDGNGKELAKMDSPNGTQGPEVLRFVATTANDYILEVGGFDAKASIGNYSIQRGEPKTVTERERKQIEAENTIVKAINLRAIGTKDSLLQAIMEFEKASILWREIGDKHWEAESINYIGLIYSGMSNIPKSLEYYNQALLIAKNGQYKKGEAKYMQNVGAAYNNLGQFDKALENFTQSLLISRETGDKENEATVLNNIAFSYANKGDKERALAAYNQSLSIFIAIGHKLGQAHTTGSIGTLYGKMGEPKKGLEYLKQALSLHREMNDKRNEAVTLLAIGAAYNAFGEILTALDFYKQALPVLESVGYKNAEAVTLNNIGVAYSNLAENQKALEYLEKGLKILREISDRVGEATTLGTIGTTYLDLGEYRKAIDILNQSLSLHKTTGNKNGEAEALTRVGYAYLKINDKQKALDSFNSALSIARLIGNKFIESVVLSNLGNFYSNLGDNQKGLDYYNQALPILRKIGDRISEARLLGNIGILYGELGSILKAIEYYNLSIPTLRALGDKKGEAEQLAMVMSFWEKNKNNRIAIFYGKQSINAFQQLRANIKSLDKNLQKSFLVSVEGIYRKLAELLVKTGRLPEAEQVLAMLKEEEYFEFVRRDGDLAKALDKRISLSPSEKEALETYDKIAGEITALGVEYDKLEAEKNNRATSDARRKEILARQDELDKKLEVARVALNKFLEALKDEFGKNDSRVAAVESGLQKDVERLKEPQTVVISTIVGKENLSLIVTTARAQTAHIVPISEENLNLLVAEFRAAMMDSRSEKWREPAQKLYDVLIKPLQKDLDNVRARTLVWSLDGMLRYAPIAALWDKEQGFLIQRYANAVFTLASRSDLSQRADGKNRWQALGVGVSKPFAGFSALSYVPQELSGIVRDASVQSKEKQSGILNGKRLLNEDFTFDNFRLYLGRFPVVHAATHFSFIPGTRAEALDSFLLLGNGEKLTLGQMQKAGTIFSGVELLALSACDTAYGGKDADGREIENFGALAQNKGAKSVLASLWRVADASTRDLMINFYANYKNPNLSKAEALRQSQLALLAEPDKIANRKQLNNGAKKYAHPFYWSPFVLIGNWQ